MGTKRRYTPEEIIAKLREAEVLTSQGRTVAEACRIIEISEQTYSPWRKEYGGMDTTQARKLKELVANLSLDNAILKEVLKK